jgi:hypothetical protein
LFFNLALRNLLDHAALGPDNVASPLRWLLASAESDSSSAIDAGVDNIDESGSFA